VTFLAVTAVTVPPVRRAHPTEAAYWIVIHPRWYEGRPLSSNAGTAADSRCAFGDGIETRERDRLNLAIGPVVARGTRRAVWVSLPKR
jgi:hypothetical protein